jgi:hypothetical protein
MEKGNTKSWPPDLSGDLTFSARSSNTVKMSPQETLSDRKYSQLISFLRDKHFILYNKKKKRKKKTTKKPNKQDVISRKIMW